MMSSFLSPSTSETTLEGCWLKGLNFLSCCSHQKDDWGRNGGWQRLFLLCPSNPGNRDRLLGHNKEWLKEWIAPYSLSWKEQQRQLILFLPSEELHFRKSVLFCGRHIEQKVNTCIFFSVSDTLCVLDKLPHPSVGLWNEVNNYYLPCQRALKWVSKGCSKRAKYDCHYCCWYLKRKLLVLDVGILQAKLLFFIRTFTAHFWSK